MQAASTFSFNINKEIGGNSAVLYGQSYIQCVTASHVKLNTQILGPHLETDHSAKKVERTIIPAPSGKKWLRDPLPGTEMKLVWIWTELICQHYHLCSARSLARRQASAVDILPQSNCLEDMSVSHDLAKGKLCTYHPLSDLSAGHGSLLPIPLSIISVPSALAIFSHWLLFSPHSTTLLSPYDRPFWAQGKTHIVSSPGIKPHFSVCSLFLFGWPKKFRSDQMYFYVMTKGIWPELTQIYFRENKHTVTVCVQS